MQLFLELFKLMNNKFLLIEWYLCPHFWHTLLSILQSALTNWIDNNKKKKCAHERERMSWSVNISSCCPDAGWCNYIMTFHLLVYHIVTGNRVTRAIMLHIFVTSKKSRESYQANFFMLRYGLSKNYILGGALWWLLFFQLERRTVTYNREFIIFIGISSDVVLFIGPCVRLCAGFQQHMASVFRLINWLKIGWKIYWCFEHGWIRKKSFIYWNVFMRGCFTALFSAACSQKPAFDVENVCFQLFLVGAWLTDKDTNVQGRHGVRANVNQALVLFN